MSNGIPRLLFLDNAKCHIPTDHTSLNSRDEVYFLVAGGTSGGQQIKVAPDAPSRGWSRDGIAPAASS